MTMRPARRITALLLSTCIASASVPAPLLAQSDQHWDDYARPPTEAGQGSRFSAPSVPEHAITNLRPGERPPRGSDEDGLWMVMDDVERQLRASGRIVIDAGLQAYVEGIICRLAPNHCADIRVYIVRTPHFNANMAPNGVMQVWSGLLLRTQNEAQLAYVLAHELAHYIRRHSLTNWRRWRDTNNAMAFFGLLTAAAGVGFVGSIGQLIAASALFAYNRDQEREADALGIEMMAAAGYDPREAPKSWQGLLAERADSDGKESTIFFATHPPTEERIATLTAAATKLQPQPDAVVGAEPLATATAPHRTVWFEDELLRREPKQSRVLIERLLADDGDNGFLLYLLGETYRQEYSDEGNAKAQALYDKALATDMPPPETLRSLGLIAWSTGDMESASAHFRRYLDMAPKADDRDMVASYLKELEE